MRKWGKIGAPKSAKRKSFLATIRGKRKKATKRTKRTKRTSRK